jgi:hypothetical protein
MASEMNVFRLGYVENPESALCVVGAEQGLFRQAGLEVTLVRFPDPSDVLEALGKGNIEAGAIPADDALNAIAQGVDVRIIAGGGTETRQAQGIGGIWESEPGSVVLIHGRLSTPRDKRTVTRLTAALIRAHQYLAKQQRNPAQREAAIKPGSTQVTFNPNPDYWRLERLWQRLGLSDPAKPGDFLANHVYEEIYCDALDQILVDSDLNDPVLKQLFDKAVCVPNCCPGNTGKLFTTLQGGSPQ